MYIRGNKGHKARILFVYYLPKLYLSLITAATALPNCTKYSNVSFPISLKALGQLLLSAFLVFSVLPSFSQCANNNTYWTALNPTGPGNTQTTGCIWGGEYVTVNVCQGASYTFATCGSGWDTFITVYPSTGGGALGWNDDGCGLQSTVTWTATFSGTVWVLVDYWTCANYAACATLSVTQNTACGGGGGGPVGDCVYTLTAGGGIFDGEISWSVIDDQGATVSSGFANTPNGTVLCLEEGCYTLNLFDSWGDGWNGAVITIFNDLGELLFTGTLGAGSFGSYNFCTYPPPPPPAPCYFAEPTGCPDITCEADIALPMCFDPCGALEVEATVFETGATTSYEVCAINYNPPYSFNAGTGFSIGVDDVWTGLISLPFNFCFFGNVYNQVVVGSNGLLSFNAGYANGFCPWAFTSTCPSPVLPLNAIFGPYHDIDPAVCGDAKYAILGSYPCRAFVVNFDNICQFSCNNLVSTHQIVIYETTNVIEVHTQSKPTCYAWNSGNALIGIQNADGSQGFVAPGRQTGPWTSSNESWRFTPNGAPNFVVEWFEAGTYLGTGTTVEVCPSEPTHTYQAVATYTNCNGTEVVVQDEVTVVCQSIMLPIELTDFQAKNRGRFVDLTWQTQTEWNSEKFVLQRSADTENWQDIGEHEAAGYSQTTLDYWWIDDKPLPGLSYYRLKQMDFDGAFDYSEVRAVERNAALQGPFVMPNPNHGFMQVKADLTTSKVKILDAVGKEVAYTIPAPGTIQMNHAAAGTYVMEVLDLRGEVIFRERFVVE